MNSRGTLTACLAASVAAWCGLGTTAAAQPAANHLSEGVEVLTRGPVHEAFAGTVTFDPQPGIVVRRAPPAAIEELPPEMKPEGANVAWIPGYWAWDDDRDDFVWISGTWRNLPPGRQWISGYWGDSPQGVQWTSGYWADAAATDVEYLPEPPESVEAGPSTAAPPGEYTWLPGCWVWQQNRYAWRPGFWSVVQPDWVWIPAHYLWAPRGYVYVDGYWDYAVDRRGILFAPVNFQSSVSAQQNFQYTPASVIDVAALVNHLFLRPSYGHYYYGDYYDSRYATAGFLASYAYSVSRSGYEPIYARQRWEHRQERDWERRVRSDFQHRRDHREARPPRTYKAQQELVSRGLTEKDRGRVFTQPLEQYSQARDRQFRLQPVSNEDRQRLGRTGQEVRAYRENRQKLEARTADPAASRPGRTSEPARARLPRSPFVAKNASELGKDFNPPRMHEVPGTDPGVTPRVRRPGIGSGAPRGNASPEPARGKPTVRPGPGVGPEPRPMTRPKTGRRPGPEVEPGSRPKSEPKGKPKTEPMPRPKAEPKTEPVPRPKAEPKTEPMPRPKSEPKTEPVPRPKAEPKTEPMPRPKSEPKTEPMPRPKSEPKTEPIPRPKSEPKTEPMPQPKAEPKTEPGPRPKGEPGGGKKGGAVPERPKPGTGDQPGRGPKNRPGSEA